MFSCGSSARTCSVTTRVAASSPAASMCREKTAAPLSCRISGSASVSSSASTGSASAPRPSSVSGGSAFSASLPVASSGSVSVSGSVSSAFTSESPSGSTQETRTSAPARPLLTSTTRSAIVSPAFRLSVCGSSRALIFAPQSCTRGSATRLPSTRSAPVSRRMASSSPSSASSFTVIGKTSVVVNGSSPAAADAFTSPRICRWLRVKPSGRSPESVTSAGRISSTGTVFSAVPALAISTA